MPELPEVEILVRHLAPSLEGRSIERVEVLRAKAIRPLDSLEFQVALLGARVRRVTRRAKYLRFVMVHPVEGREWVLLGHLGMTGRMYLQHRRRMREKHVSVVFGLGDEDWVFEDPRQFGGFALGEERLSGLGPEPLEEGFTSEVLSEVLGRSRQSVKVRLMDQAAIAGLGNIYACESLNVAGIAPSREASSLKPREVVRLHDAIRQVLGGAIRLGLSLPLDPTGDGIRDGLFYFGRASGADDTVSERFRVYDREGKPCLRCATLIQRKWMGGRGTFFCPKCQR